MARLTEGEQSVSPGSAPTHRLFDNLALAGELAETARVFGRIHMPTADGVGHIADVEVAAGVHCHAMGRDELRRAFPFLGVAKPSLHFPFQVVNADPMPQAGRVVHPTHAIEFPDEEVALGIQTDAVRPMDVVPHGDEPAVGIEYGL